MNKILSEFQLQDILVQYIINENHIVGMELIPTHMKNQKRSKEYQVDSLIQLKLEGDDFPFGFANGHTMRNSQSTYGMKYKQQYKEELQSGLRIVTVLADDRDQYAEHILEYDNEYQVISIKTVYYNKSSNPIALEMLSSFSLCGLTPFEENEAPDTMLIHRLRSKWSSEGRLETNTVEELMLEPSWSRHGSYSEKFGQVGSMPVRKFFPFIAVEDKKNKVTWAAQLGCASSWQMEAYRRDNGLCISGGLADYDFGHWLKLLNPGEHFETPEAYITVFNGSMDEACQRLTRYQKKPLLKHKLWDKLPVVFNEYCTTWGNPSHENICKILEVIKNRGFDYFIIDAGWYADKEKGWDTYIGDWIICKEMFPDGLAATVSLIKEAGLIPGIWFELEVCARDAKAFSFEDHLLKRNGKTLTVGDRRFWDMRDPWTNEYLAGKVIDLLNKYGFKYIKIDYNDNIGIGCDGAESLGEGLRQNILATQQFFQKIRDEVPGIAIEICSSGGHRIEPSMLALADMISFSDAHEEREIPIIAANLHRALLPEQSQIWAVLRKNDTEQRLIYSIINTFLGVMCLSGDVYDLNESQWELVQEGISFYRKVSTIIQNGVTEFYGTQITSYRFPKGWQGIVRYSLDHKEVMVVIHSFEIEEDVPIIINLKQGYQIIDKYEEHDHDIKMTDNNLQLTMDKGYDAVAVYLNLQ